MDYASTGDALSFEASVAASQQLQKLEALVTSLEAEGGTIFADPELRASLARIASALGIDPLQLNLKGLGGAEGQLERANRLEVAVVEACRDLRAQSGGSVSAAQLAQRLNRFFEFKVTEDEVLAAVDNLAVLGPGLRTETLPNGTKVVRSVAGELSSDQGAVLVACDALGFVTADLLTDNLGWELDRAQQVVDDMVSCGLLWVDLQCVPTQYWTPSVI